MKIMVRQEVRRLSGRSALLVNSNEGSQVTVDWFDARYWGGRAVPVSSGGRGSAWFLQDGDRSLVLREYRRGGVIAKFSESTYWYLGEGRVRSFAEFRLLNELYALNMPVPQPVAAWYEKVTPVTYRAAIIIERIEGGVPLPDVMPSMSSQDWGRLGALIKRFHNLNVRHADLNCYNILVSDGKFSVIDFDRGQIMRGSGKQWKKSNLDRFARSIRKVAGQKTYDRVWDCFVRGYNGSNGV